MNKPTPKPTQAIAAVKAKAVAKPKVLASKATAPVAHSTRMVATPIAQINCSQDGVLAQIISENGVMKVVPVSSASATQTKPATQTTPITPITFSTTGNEVASKAPAAVAPKKMVAMHVVQSGETLYSISRLYGYSLEVFALMNGLTPNSTLKTGQQLQTINNAVPISSAVVAPQTLSAKTPETVFIKQTVEHAESVVSYARPASEEEVYPSTYTYAESQSNASQAVVPVESAYVSANPVQQHEVVTYYSGSPIKTHTMSEGDSLESIATKYKTTVTRLREWNQLEANEVLPNGKTLIVQK